MNKQEAIEKIKNIETLHINDIIAGQRFAMVIKNQVLDIVSQIDEPQKVVVPKFVAEWIKEARAKEYSLYGALDMVKKGSDVFWWLFDSHGSNQDTFNRAWLDGYEVETEKLYTVEIGGVESSKLFKHIRKNKYRFHCGKELEGYTDKLTEQEIKKADERLWQFAKPAF